ncbi:MATE family efflux transporter [Pseudoflavonifractor sp. 60]|uniref:MATE family efflux transporter n=1 Tax=Pseudoflavonifractor sp. 60 TaxID=2304576 RepID=UPI00136E2FC0|nr:MATE family efflux transporter [Pseudoflavonifractor sp. 60]NBI67376.1 MATE family efflux transporter [Pseudoflavonifractor sp. 60]
MPHLPNRHQAHPDQRTKMLETPVDKLILTLAAPTIVSMLVTSIYNMADTYFVSQLNTSASGAVGVVFSLMAIIQAVGFTVGMGSGSIASRLLGQDRGEEANTYASSGVAAALVVGALMAGTGLALREQLIWLLGSTATIHPYAMDYALYIILGAPVMILSFTLNNLLRWQGKANLSVFGLATGGILNMVLDPIFIYLLDMGIAGAGAATLLSQCVSLCILTSFFLLNKSDLKVTPGKISRSPGIYLAILKQGMPSFFRQGVLSAATMALNYNAKIYGDAAVAALSIVTKVFMVIQSIVIGFGQGFQPVLGYNYGAKRLDRVKEAVSFSVKTCTVILTVGAVVGFFLAPHIIAQFRRDDAMVIAIGTRAFRYQCLTLPLGAVLVFANMFFQSLGKSWRAVVLAVCRQGLYIPLVYIMSARLGLSGLEMTQACADVLSFVLSASVIVHYFKTEFGRE